jgi:hypothetical protein
MKKITLAIFIALFSFASFAQRPTKPTIMIVPSDVWCNQNGFMTTYNNQGSVTKVPDYKRAFQEDPTLVQVIAQINGMMAERGFPLENLETKLKDLATDDAFDNASDADGNGSASNLVDELKKVATADIWMQITYNVNTSGFDKSIQFTLQGLDAYTNKQIATATGNGEPSSGSTPELMQEAVLAHLDNFNSTLMTYFDDLFENGREVVFLIKVRDDWGEDLYTEEYGDDELMVLIEDFVYEFTENHVFSLASSGDYSMRFTQCRIPMLVVDKRGNTKANNAKLFGRQIKNKLKAIGVTSRFGPRDGLGTCTLVIGEK